MSDTVKKNSVGAKLYGLGANKQIEREREREGEREEKDEFRIAGCWLINYISNQLH